MVRPAIILRTAMDRRAKPCGWTSPLLPVWTRAQQPLLHHKQSRHGHTYVDSFVAAIRSLTSAYEDLDVDRVVDEIRPSISDQMRREIAQNAEEFDPLTDQASGYEITVEEAATPLVSSTTTPPPVVETQRRSITPNNRSLAVLESGQLVVPQCHMPLARGAVSSASIASTDLQAFVEPLPLDQLICLTPRSVQAWPTAARVEVLAVAHRDLAVARLVASGRPYRKLDVTSSGCLCHRI